MNICLFISSLKYGGAEKQAVLDANLLSNSHKVYLITYVDGPQKSSLNKEVELIIFPKFSYPLAAWKLSRFVKQHRIDVIYSFLFAPMIVSALSGIWHSASVIWAFHSHEYDVPFKSKVVFFLCSRLPGVRKILFVNRELKQYFVSRLWVPAKKTGILYNSSTFRDKDHRPARHNETIHIGYVGRLVELKRIHYLIELADYLNKSQVHNFHIHIVGDGPARDSLEKLVQILDVSDKITFYGFHSEIERYYDYFHLFINPSREECLSIALIDAGMKGIPSIAFDVGGNSEIILHDESGFIVQNKTELFEITRKMITHPQMIRDLGDRASIHCKEHFSEEAHLENLTKILEASA